MTWSIQPFESARNVRLDRFNDIHHRQFLEMIRVITPPDDGVLDQMGIPHQQHASQNVRVVTPDRLGSVVGIVRDHLEII